MKKIEVIKEHDISRSRLEEYLNDGFELKFVVPEIMSMYQATKFETRVLYILTKEYEE